MTVPSRHLKRVLVFGYLGGRNFGDELMLIGLIDELRQRGADAIRIITPAGHLPAHLEGQVQLAYPRTAAGVTRALLWASAFVVCGGTMFHDSFGDARHRAYRRNLAAIAGLCAAARAMGRKVLLLGIGMGPFHRRSTKATARLAIASASEIRVRDRSSFKDVEALGDPEAKLSLGSDLAFGVMARLPAPASQDPPALVLSPVPPALVSTATPSEAHAFLPTLLDALRSFLEAHADWRITVLAAAVGEVDDDRDVASRFSATLGEAFPGRVAFMPFDGDPFRVLGQLAGARAVMASRYHVATAAELAGVPTLWMPYQRKVQDSAAEMGVEDSRIVALSPAGAAKARAWLETV